MKRWIKQDRVGNAEDDSGASRLVIQEDMLRNA